MTLPGFLIFVSSPGDVAEERAIADRVIRRLRDEWDGAVAITGIFWEHEPLLASASFQAQILRPADTDVAVCILWARIGTRLPGDFSRPDGTRFDSGTEFEFEDALDGYRRVGRPDLLVYRKTSEPIVSLRDEQAVLTTLEQKRKLDAFVSRWFHNSEDGTLRAAFHSFDGPARFEELLETHLRKVLDRRFPGVRRQQNHWIHGSPFRGLEAFDFDHAEVFFGRTQATADVLRALRVRRTDGTGFVLVLGASGTGKSSLVRAGVVPMLTQPGVIEGARVWRRAAVRPGESPLAAITNARGREDADDIHVVLVADQMEELFTNEDLDLSAREQFVEELEKAASDPTVWVLATMRSDYYARCEELPRLASLKAGAGEYHLLPPARAEIAEMVRLPVRAAGLRLEEQGHEGASLEDQLLEAASGQQGALPLLEFTLDQLFTNRSADGLLTLAAYEALGGVEGALSTRAEAAFKALPAQTRDALPEVLRAVARVSSDLTSELPSRRAAVLDRMSLPARRLVDAFIAERLFVAERAPDGLSTVTVAHEALFRHWPRVAEWFDSDREFLRLRARVESASVVWNDEGRSDQFLLAPGKPLTDAEHMVQRPGSQLHEDVRAFVQRSVDVAQAARRRQRVIRAAAVMVLALTSVAGFALWRRAEGLRQESERQHAGTLRVAELLAAEGLPLAIPGDTLLDDQVQLVRALVRELASQGFRGTVRLSPNFGRFQPVPRSDPVTRQLRAVAAAQSESGARIEVVAPASEALFAPYPQGGRPADWKASAQRNHRVGVMLIPAEP